MNDNDEVKIVDFGVSEKLDSKIGRRKKLIGKK